ncbi:MAG: double-cubane-cluster-containing anaerobic reductase [Armatimonadota bacterium]
MNSDREMWAKLGLDVELHDQLLQTIDHSFASQVLTQTHRPAAMAYFDEAVHAAHGERVREIIAHREAGGKFVGTFCIFVPDELILALGGIPFALCGGTSFTEPYAERLMPRDICPLIKSTLGLAFSKTCPYAPLEDLAVGETTCDAKKKVWDFLAPRSHFHVMEVPQKKQPRDQRLWHEEVMDLKERLEEVSGRVLDRDNLAAATRLMNRKRRALQALNELRKADRPPLSGLDALLVSQIALIDDVTRFCERLEELNEELAERVRQGIGVAAADTPRLMLSGCPSVLGNWKLHSVIESSGGLIVCDESCTGTRYYSELVDETPADLEGQIAALAQRYLQIDCACFSPNTERLDNVVALAREYRVCGVVHYVLQYCHGYNVEAVGLTSALKKAGLRSLKINTDYSAEDTQQLRTRVEAFLEVRA